LVTVNRYLNCPASVGGGSELATAASSATSAGERPWDEEDGGAFRYWPSFHATVDTGGTTIADGAPKRHSDTESEGLAGSDTSSTCTIEPCEREQVKHQHSVDVLPGGGTVVMFDSRRLRHAVCPTQRRRIALSAWFVSAATVVDSCEL
jgi:hypothetical protein